MVRVQFPCVFPPADVTALERIDSLERRVARHDTMLKQSIDVMSRLAEPSQ